MEPMQQLNSEIMRAARELGAISRDGHPPLTTILKTQGIVARLQNALVEQLAHQLERSTKRPSQRPPETDGKG